MNVQGGERNRGRRIPPRRLQDNSCALIALIAELLSHHEAVLGVAHHNRRGALEPSEPSLGLLQHGTFSAQGQKLFRAGRATDRPQAAANTTG